MNQLLRMVLVNSANVRYREVLLDGHIHFIGTQGTGKSTLLRALLFFYNANQRTLGIPKEKKSFSEYYLPYADSYIFYEVRAGMRRFCVWLYKRQNRLCFRFVDGAYDRSLAIEGNTARSESEVMTKAAMLGFKVERAIYSLKEYRDVLYGENRSMRRYALMQNVSNYSTIPRTISNIFLNANLDGDYIKKTIIDSLSDESAEINLETNRRHLETARKHYDDVFQYQRNEQQAERIVSAYAAILVLEEQQREVAWKIGAAYNRAREQKHGLEERCTREAEAEQKQREKLEAIRNQVETEKRRLGDRLAVIKRDIQKANQLKREYAAKGIETLRKEAQRAPELEQQLAHCTEQLRALTAQVEQQEQQFEIAAKQLENGCAERVSQVRTALSDTKDQIRKEQDAAREAFDKEKETIKGEHEELCSGYLSEKRELENTHNERRFQLRQLDQTRFFEEERRTLEVRKTELDQQHIRAQELKIHVESAIDTLLREVDDRRKIARAEGDDLLRPLTDERRKLQDLVAERRRELEALSDSLLVYLDDHIEGWRANIGKVVDRDVLLKSTLEPREADGNSLYGVELKLDRLATKPISRNELEDGIKSTEEELASLAIKIEKQSEENRAEQDRLTQAYNRKIREQRERDKSTVAELFMLERDLERTAMSLSDLEERVASTRAEKHADLEEGLYQSQAKLDELDALITEREDRRNAALKRIETDYRRRDKALIKETARSDAEAESNITRQGQLLNENLGKLKAQRETLLNELGVDARRVAEIEQQSTHLRKLLDAVKKNEQLLIEYQKDKRDWIGKLEEFQRDRVNLEDKLRHQTELFERRIKNEQSLLDGISAGLRLLRDEERQVSEEIVAFEHFERDELFDVFKTFISHHDLSETTTCRERIDELKNLAWKFERQHKQLTTHITEFSGMFGEGNCLGFEVHLTDESSFRSFAENLVAFVREQKIVTLKTEVTRKYSMVLEAIVTETNRLLQREDEVHSVIKKINADFRRSNFVGVVHSIEMRLQQSNNRIFEVLREICQFQTENYMSFGELDLFNRGDSGNDEKAVDLLEQLRNQIGQTKGTRLKLEDALELEFRVRENENDTNWVSRLANVGSHGTDVLVKSMIYINLLNIFKEGGRKQSESAMMHCLVDEVGILHDSNVTSLINFAAERGINMINGSPNSHNEQDYKHIYIFQKDKENQTTITKLISHVS